MADMSNSVTDQSSPWPNNSFIFDASDDSNAEIKINFLYCFN
jgi:hypothetical protein